MSKPKRPRGRPRKVQNKIFVEINTSFSVASVKLGYEVGTTLASLMENYGSSQWRVVEYDSETGAKIIHPKPKAKP